MEESKYPTNIEADIDHGAKLFKTKCSVCHSLHPNTNKAAPTLYNIFNRSAGTVEGYAYSSAHKGSSVIWNEDTLFNYLENPKAFMPGTKKVFIGVKNEQERVDIIAYLKIATAPTNE